MKQKDDLKNERFAGYRAAQHLFEDALQDLCDEDERYILCYYDNYYSKKSVTEKDMTKPLATLFGPLLRDGISLKTIANFDAGFADSGELSKLERYYDIDCDRFKCLQGRLTFPLRNDYGDIVGFVGRRAADASGARWMLALNEKDKSDGILFGLDRAKHSSKDWFLLCEWIPEVMLLHQHGYDNAVCPIGSQFLTERHAELLKKHRKAVTVVLNNNDSGRNMTAKVVKMLSACGLSVSTPSVYATTNERDLIGLLKCKDGRMLFEDALRCALPKNVIERMLHNIFDQHDLRILDERINCAKECVDAVGNLPVMHSYILDGCAGEIARKTGISKKVLIWEIKQLNKLMTDDDLPF